MYLQITSVITNKISNHIKFFTLALSVLWFIRILPCVWCTKSSPDRLQIWKIVSQWSKSRPRRQPRLIDEHISICGWPRTRLDFNITSTAFMRSFTFNKYPVCTPMSFWQHIVVNLKHATRNHIYINSYPIRIHCSWQWTSWKTVDPNAVFKQFSKSLN